MNHNPMPDYQFWWNHLTYQQREFIQSKITMTDNLCTLEQVAWNIRESLRNMDGWPIENFFKG